MLIMELPVGAKKEKKEVALNNLSAIMDRWGATNIIITTRTITIIKLSWIGGGQNFTNPIAIVVILEGIITTQRPCRPITMVT